MRLFFYYFLFILIISFCTEDSFSATKRQKKSLEWFHSENDQRINESNHFQLMCPLCLELPLDTVFLPCNHVTSCYRCSLKIENCPQCRKKVTKKIHPVSFDFLPEANHQSGGGDSSEVDALCINCERNPISVLHSSCRCIGLCHECAEQFQLCPHCHINVQKHSIRNVYITFVPELKSEDFALSTGLDHGRLDLGQKNRLQLFLEHVRPTVDLLAEVESYSRQEDLSIRSGQELVVRAQAGVIVSCGLEFSVGKYATRGWRGIPYLRLSWVLGGGAPAAATVSMSYRHYSQRSDHPLADFSVAGTENSQVSYASVIGIARHDVPESPESGQQASIRERGISVGMFGSFVENGGNIIQVPICFPAQFFSKKGRLLMKAKNLEKKFIHLIRKGDWQTVYEKTLPAYQATTQELFARVSRRNTIERTHQAIPVDHPFYNLDNLMHAVGSVPDESAALLH